METQDLCPDCLKTTDQCVCCLGCGHICDLDRGEPFCPVCKPEPKELEEK